MSRLSQIWITLWAVLLWAGLGQLRVQDGALYVSHFQGDALHMAQGVLRMAAGEVPHLSFETPLGVLAFAPMAWLVKSGFGLGAAFGYAPIVLGLLWVPVLLWAVLTRLSLWPALGFVSVVCVQMMALVHGGDTPLVAVSMYYNNWGWGLSAIVVLLCWADPRQVGKWGRFIDGVLIGILMAWLLLLKVTYAVYLFPALCLLLWARQAPMTFGIGLGVGLLALGLAGWSFGGTPFWQAYIADLRFVAGSDIRAHPGLSISAMVLAPVHFTALLLGLALAVLLRQSGSERLGLSLLALIAGWTMIAQQNWQNDPHWLILAGLLILGAVPEIEAYNRFGWPVRQSFAVCAAGLVALGLPLLLAQGQSVWRHSLSDPAQFLALDLPDADQSLKLRQVKGRVPRVEYAHPGIAPHPETPTKPVVLNGEALPACTQTAGLAEGLQAIGASLRSFPELAGHSAIYADWVNAIWLFSDLNPVPGGAPWYYGGTPGFENADYLVVPLCPMGPAVQRRMLEASDRAGFQFAEIARTDLYVLLKQVK